MITVRIPPSPTGHLHLGTARTVLFNYAFAKKNNGKIVFRWEDTDKERSKTEYEDEIIDGLKWLGMDFKKESSLFIRQTDNEQLHKDNLKKLWEKGSIFPCFVTTDELDAQRKKASEEKTNFVFWSPFRDEKKELLEEKMKSGERFVWRIKAPKDYIVSFDDEIRGKVSINTNTLGDFVVARGDGSVLYLLANVLDDWTQGITHIFRGEDHISNTPKQILLYEALGADLPVFGHIPFVLDQGRKKLSKRTVTPGTCVLISDFQESGFLPEAVVNGLALTGWNPKSTEEIFSLEKLCEVFDIKGVNSSAAQYDFKKMEWFNTYWVRNINTKTLIQRYNDFAKTNYGENDEKIFDVARMKARNLNEVGDQLVYFYEKPTPEIDLLLNEKMKIDKGTLEIIFPEIQTMLENIPENEFTAENLHAKSVEAIAKLELKNGQFLNPFRIALSGQSVSAGPFDIGAVVGKTETIERIKNVIKIIK